MNNEDEIDKEVARILAMSDEEVLAEVKTMGLNLDEEVKKFHSILELAIADCEFEKQFGK